MQVDRKERFVAIDGFAGGGGASEGLRMAGINVSIAMKEGRSYEVCLQYNQNMV